jgi:peptidase M28-like protein
MGKLVASLRRIVLAVAGTLLVLVLAFAWVVRQPNFGSLPFPDGSRAESEALKRHVAFLATADHPRNPRHPDDIERAATYVAAELSRSGGRVSDEPYLAYGARTRNLILRLGPDHGPLIVVGAHYDVCADLPGADDNASGVAGLLELARLLGSRKLSSPVELVAFSSEEPPYFGGPDMGSAVHAAGLRKAGVELRAMIGLEMIGYFKGSERLPSILLYSIYPHRGDFISVAGRWEDRGLLKLAKRCFRGASPVPVVSYSGPVSVGSDLSDHRNFWELGYPAFMVTDTADLRNPNYHEPGDLPATLDYERMAGVVDGLLSTVVHLAND